MFGDIQTRSGRMKRLPPVTFSEYLKPLLGGFVVAITLYVLMFAQYVIGNALIWL